jgi:threonine/homoserine/homoserine lactone efflux protein
MTQSIGTIVLVILGLIVVAAVLNFVLGVLGIVLALIPFLVKLAIVGGLLYLGWMALQKLTRSTEG